MIHLRGQIVTVIDLRAVLDVSPADDGETRPLIIVRHRDELIGLLADELDDIVTAPAEQTYAPRVLGDRQGEGLVERLLERDEQLVSVLDVDRVLR